MRVRSIIERKELWAQKMAGKRRFVARSEKRLPPGQHLTNGFPVLDLGVRPKVSLSEWTLELKGEVENPLTLTWEQFNQLPRFQDTSDFHCVTTWSKFDCQWAGIAFFTLVDLVGKAQNLSGQLSSERTISVAFGKTAATARSVIHGRKTDS
jgi:DMSO/TMAO reductase YedYZ molybdopterin-dependent catalytic subunit